MGDKKAELTPEELAKREEEELTPVHSPFSLSPSKATLRSSSTAAIIRNYSLGSKPSSATATWCWRMSRRCGPSFQRLERGRRNPNPSTRIDLSVKCFSVGIL